MTDHAITYGTRRLSPRYSGFLSPLIMHESPSFGFCFPVPTNCPHTDTDTDTITILLALSSHLLGESRQVLRGAGASDLLKSNDTLPGHVSSINPYSIIIYLDFFFPTHKVETVGHATRRSPGKISCRESEDQNGGRPLAGL
jgi:hypothetical protein